LSASQQNNYTMSGKITLTMIKPLAVQKGFIGPILAKIAEGGFRIVAMKYTKLTVEQAQKFYEVHKERPFYTSLVNSMSSGPIVAAILEKENAVQAYRDFIGATNPANAAPGTIRALYGTSLEANAVHGSDSDENANIESDFFFSKLERF
jgi:nucleoside-diphosphate kinase